jgi:hypothetical protein
MQGAANEVVSSSLLLPLPERAELRSERRS